MVAADVDLCVAWARRHFHDAAAAERLAHLTGRVVAAADGSGRPLFAAWRALPDPSHDAAARVGLALLRLREHRGSSHLISVVAEGLTPLEAILVDSGAGKAAANGWAPPYPGVQDGTMRIAAVNRRTDALAGLPYAALDVAERVELLRLLESAHRAYRNPARIRPSAAHD
jgi:hypothetical protein